MKGEGLCIDIDLELCLAFTAWRLTVKRDFSIPGIGSSWRGEEGSYVHALVKLDLKIEDKGKAVSCYSAIFVCISRFH